MNLNDELDRAFAAREMGPAPRLTRDEALEQADEAGDAADLAFAIRDHYEAHGAGYLPESIAKSVGYLSGWGIEVLHRELELNEIVLQTVPVCIVGRDYLEIARVA